MPERRAWEREFPRGDPAARRLLLRALMNVRRTPSKPSPDGSAAPRPSWSAPARGSPPPPATNTAARASAGSSPTSPPRGTLFLDLGSGWNTPGIFKVPFWRMTLRRPEARYACVNLEPDQLPAELGDRAVHVASDIGAALARLA